MGLAAFRRLAAAHTLIPVTREVLADLDTPVAAFWKLQRGRHSFLLESVEGGETWARFTFMGTEPRAVYTARGATITITTPDTGESRQLEASDPLAWLTEELGRERFYHDPELPRFVGGLVGALGYDAVRWMERLPEENAPREDLPDLCFMATRLVLVWDNLKHRAMLVYLAHVPAPAGADAAWSQAQTALDEAQARLDGPLPALPTCPSRAPIEPTVTVSDARYCEAVEQARQFITAGDVIQVVLSRRFTQPAAGLHPFSVYRTLRGLNPSPYMFYLTLGDASVVGSSPEALVRLTDGLVEARPIAGTRPRGATKEEDDALAESLLADPKERAEHVMLVDLARNDVGRVAEIGSVEVHEQMIIERYSHVMHLVSHVQGRCRPGLTPADVVSATFPAGTLSGAPKIRAMEIIEAMEPERRGFYGGAVGTLGYEGNLDLAIAIRTLVAVDGRLDVQAGAGIVYDSVPTTEAEETVSKARAVLKAIDMARELFGEDGVKLLMIDNYDSFTFNLVQYLGELGAEVDVVRNDTLTVDEALGRGADAIVVSPGPCTPAEAGISVALIREASGRVPLLGVCLGHQSLGVAFGGRIVRAGVIMHGKTSPIHHHDSDVFRDLPNPFEATRYHSLVIEPSSLPECLEVTAWTDDPQRRTIMGVRHREHPTWGVQFHPESILTTAGKRLLGNFLALARAAAGRPDERASA